MKYKYILFDLDGTLTDPALGITNSIMYALKKFNITVTDRTELYKFIGPPLWESFEKFYGFSKEQSIKAVDYYREYYTDTGIYENSVYSTMEDLLKYLKASGRTLLVATSKPEVFAKQVLDHFNLTGFFDFISGGDLDGTRAKKDEVIAYALEQCHITEPESCVMIGDREHDILGAKKTGLASVGVLYGYGNREELENAGADYIAASISELKTLFEGEVL